MTIDEIDKKISEYQKKLQEKVFVQTRKGVKKRGIQGHLSSYIRAELSKLEKLKSHLLEQKNEIVYINWDKIKFDNSTVWLLINSTKWYSYPLKISRKSFEFLRPYFIKFSLPMIEVVTCQNKIKSIKNLNEITTTLNILSFQDELSKELYSLPNVDFSKLNIKYSSLTNDDITNTFKLKEKGKYIKHLCEIQSDGLKIIPINEISSFYDTNKVYSDSFLFSIEKKEQIYVVWESSEINKATYIFELAKRNYFDVIQLIFNYIVSDETVKRMRLRKAIKNKQNNLHVIDFIEHESFHTWLLELDKTIV